MGRAKHYQLTLTGESPLIMHKDHVSFSERVQKWCKAPENKLLSRNGDDRTPAWTWLGYLYLEEGKVGIPSDNLMTAICEAGAKVPVPGRGKETFKRYTQSGLTTDSIQMDLFYGPKYEYQLTEEDLSPLLSELDFEKHEQVVKELGFELMVKRAAIQRSKHVRVRPLFRNWRAVGTITVFDEESSGLTKEVLDLIMFQCGNYVGIGDWRPSSGASGSCGRFSAEIVEL